MNPQSKKTAARELKIFIALLLFSLIGIPQTISLATHGRFLSLASYRGSLPSDWINWVRASLVFSLPYIFVLLVRAFWWAFTLKPSWHDFLYQQRARLIRSRITFLFLGVFTTACISEVFPPFSIGFWRLAFASSFSIGSDVGYGGNGTADEERLYQRVLSAPTVEASMLLLYHFGNNQAKTYALIALREERSDRFKEKLTEYAQSPGYIMWRSGCTTDRISKRQMAQLIERWDTLGRVITPADEDPKP